MRMRNHQRSPRRLLCERLESRCVLSALLGDGDFHAVIVAGDPTGTPADSPAIRVDANSNAQFAGVGSLRIETTGGTYICSGTAIDNGTGSRDQVLTAGHCVDFNNDGRSDWRDAILSISFNVNYDAVPAADRQIAAASWRTHPDFTGFAKPSVNDDLAMVTLAEPLPDNVPTYALASSLPAGTTIVMVGYGRSGDGVQGYTVDPDFTVKRTGQNVADSFYAQDDRRKPAANEVFRFDFDGAAGNGPMGGPTRGNNVEATIGGGDSGGPSFVVDSVGKYRIAGVNTFTQGFTAPLFGSLGGGINVAAYVSWIQSGSGGSTGGGKGKSTGGQAGSNFIAIDAEMIASSRFDSDLASSQLAASPDDVGTGVSSTPPVLSPTGSDAYRRLSDSAWFVDSATARAAPANCGLLKAALAAEGIEDESESSDDLVLAVDTILSRWAF